MDIDLKKIIEQKRPNFFSQYSSFLAKPVLRFLEKINHVQEIQAFFNKYGHKTNWEFIDAVFEYLDFQYLVSDEDINRIPPKGRLICVANHPLGVLDALSLLKIIGTVRQDVKIIVSDILVQVENLKDLLLYYDLYSTTMQKKNLEKIRNELLKEYAIIFFPAGSVAKLTAKGIREGTWQKGPVVYARKHGVPVLPMYVNASNSLLYYLVTLISPGFSTVFLPHEIFKKRSQRIKIKIGEPMFQQEFGRKGADFFAQTEFLKNHVLKIGKTG